MYFGIIVLLLRAYIIGTLLVVFFGVSRVFFSRMAPEIRKQFILQVLILAPIWPIAIATKDGRRRMQTIFSGKGIP